MIKQTQENIQLCAYCGKEAGENRRAFKIDMVGNIRITRTVNGQAFGSWSTKRISVPRCSTCYELHKEFDRKSDKVGSIAAVLSVPVVILVYIYALASGAVELEFAALCVLAWVALLVVFLISFATGMVYKRLAQVDQSITEGRRGEEFFDTNLVPEIQTYKDLGWQVGSAPFGIRSDR